MWNFGLLKSLPSLSDMIGFVGARATEGLVRIAPPYRKQDRPVRSAKLQVRWSSKPWGFDNEQQSALGTEHHDLAASVARHKEIASRISTHTVNVDFWMVRKVIKEAWNLVGELASAWVQVKPEDLVGDYLAAHVLG